MESVKKHILILFFCTPLFLYSQSVKFTASSSKNPVPTGDRFEIIFELTNAQGSNFQAPKISDFRILGGPNQSTQISIVNGQTSSSTSYSYILLAVSEGEFEIGSASIISNGKKLTSDPFKIKVVKGASVPSNSQGSQAQQNSSSDKMGSNDGNVFIKLFTDKTKVYKGEQVNISYKIFTKGNIVDYNINHSPSFEGFWSKDVDLGRIGLQPEKYNGVNYYVAPLRKNLLFPQKNGKLTIEALKMDVVLRLKERGNPYDVFDQFFGRYQDVKYDLKSNILAIEVLPLPEQGKPNSFNGAVGNYSFSVDISKNKVKQHDALNLKIKVQGTGNIHLLEVDKPIFPSDFEIYDPKISDQINYSDAVNGKREWDYLIIPRTAGKFTIPTIRFSYFDPQKKKYIELSSPDIIIDVEKDLQANNTTSFIQGSGQKEVVSTDSDIRYIKTNTVFNTIQDTFFGSLYHIFIVLAIIIITYIVWYFNYKNNKLKSNVTLYDKQYANKKALKKFSIAQKAMDSNSDTFYEELYKGFMGYFEDKFSIPKHSLTTDSIKISLQDHIKEKSLIDNTMDIIFQVEMARFAPNVKITKQELFNKVIQTIQNLDRIK